MAAPVVSLAAWKATLSAPDEPLLPDVSPIDAIRKDWAVAMEAAGEAELAHLMATAELLGLVAEADNPADAALGIAATLWEEIRKMARERRGLR